MLRYLPTVVILHNIAAIFLSALGIGQVFDVVADGDYELVCDQPFFHQVHRKRIGHFPKHELGFLGSIWLMQHLT